MPEREREKPSCNTRATILYISTIKSDKISKIWDEIRVKFRCNKDKFWSNEDKI
jgi:hypothetical protein